MKTPIRYSGPYLFKSGKNAGRQFMVVYYSDGSRGTTLYSRYLYLKHRTSMGVIHQIDHIDEDKTNDSLNNLQELSHGENNRKHAATKPRKTITFICPECSTEKTKFLNRVKHNQKQGKVGPFCSRKCAGTYSQRVQMAKLAAARGLNPLSSGSVGSNPALDTKL